MPSREARLSRTPAMSLGWGAPPRGIDPVSLDLGELFGGFDPAGVSAHFATLLEDLTSAWVPDLATSFLSVFQAPHRLHRN